MRNIKYGAGILVLIMGFSLIWGCGLLQQSAIPPEERTHSGTITGYVYDAQTMDYTTMSFLGTPEVTVMAQVSGASANVLASATFIATTDANGYYKLESLPLGELVLTAFKDGYTSITIVTDRAIVNFPLSLHDAYVPFPPHGTARIFGEISGIPEGVTSVYGRAASKNNSSTSWSYNNATKTYEVSNAPDDGETYVLVSYVSMEAGSSVTRYAYGRVNTAPGATANLDITFGNYTTLSGSITAPLGFTVEWLSCSLNKRNYQRRGYFYSKYILGASAYEYTGLPPLLSGDTFGLSVSAYDTDQNLVTSYFYGVTGSDLDFSSLSLPTPGSSCPADEANLEGVLPSFSWDPVAGEDVYYSVGIAEILPPHGTKTIWSGLTAGTSIAFPSGIIGSGALSSGKEYQWYINAASLTPFNINDLPGSLYTNPSDNFHVNFSINTKYRKFTY